MPTNIAVFNGVAYVIDNVFCCFFNRRCGLHGGVRAPRPTVMIVFCDEIRKNMQTVWFIGVDLHGTPLHIIGGYRRNLDAVLRRLY